MKAKDLIPGFRFIYETDSRDVAIVRFCGAGVGGLLGLTRLEWVINRNDPKSILQCCSELLMKAPIWAAENGEIEAVHAEIDRWANPILHEAMRVSQLDE